MKSRLLKAKGDELSGGGMADRFAQIDKQEARRRKMKEIKAMIWGALGTIIVFGLVAGAAWFAWTSYQEAQSKKKSSGSQQAPAEGQPPPGSTPPK